jgi:DNA mismatch repair protein MutL
MDIRFRDEKGLAQFIQEEIKNTLMKNRSVKTLFPSVPSVPQVPKAYQEKSPAKLITHEQINTILNPIKYMPDNYQDTAPNLVHEVKTEQELSPFPEQKQDPPNLFTEESLSLGPLQEFRPLAQLFNTYVLATNGQILLIIDQHAAHERLNFERLLKKAKENPSASQQLLIPIPLELSIQEEQALLEHLWALTDLGFIIEHFGPRTYLLRGIPAYTGLISGEELLRKFLEQVLMKNHIPEIEQLLEEWIYLLACHESIKAKDNLSLLEMEELIIRLGQTENPFTCPHGRPTMIQITAAELNKRFYRG